MGNMNSLSEKDFDKSCVKPGYKIIGWDQAKIVLGENNIYLTAPWVGVHNGQPNYPEDDGEYMVWEGSTPLAEFLRKDHAIQFFNYLVNQYY